MTRRRASRFLALVVAVCPALGLLHAPPLAQAQAGAPPPRVTITEYPLPSPDSLPGGITVGPDGALWFHMSGANKLGRVTTDGRLAEYPIPTPDSSQVRQGFLGTGPDGAVWFTENAPGVNQI